MITEDTFTALLRVLVAGLVFGAGLPALFAVGIRLAASGRGQTQPDGTTTRSNHAALATAYAVFALVALAVLAGVLWITKDSLDHYLGIELF